MYSDNLENGKVLVTFSGEEQAQLGVGRQYTLPDQLPQLEAVLQRAAASIGGMLVVGAVQKPETLLAEVRRVCPSGDDQ